MHQPHPPPLPHQYFHTFPPSVHHILLNTTIYAPYPHHLTPHKFK
ncbi:hypothetical protein, partial [Paenibacillus xylanexedens]